MEFIKFPKIARYDRNIIITEKIDGTNAQIYIGCGHDDLPDAKPVGDWDEWGIWAGSRNRWLTPEKDNHGFAKWVAANQQDLIAHLGPGLHYGEWWGQGIQRKYGLDHHRFSLFNVIRWNPDMYHQFKVGPWIESIGKKGGPDQPKPWNEPPDCCHVVPVLYTGPWIVGDGIGTPATISALLGLQVYGSTAAPGFAKPEGIVIYHPQGHILFKATLDDDGGKHGNQ